MIPYIAEKPNLGRAIASGLCAQQTKCDGFISLPNGDVVSWCIGHLLEQAVPEQYDDRYKKWDLNDLPISPQQWQLTPKANTKKQLSVLRKLIKQANMLVNAGDPDRVTINRYMFDIVFFFYNSINKFILALPLLDRSIRVITLTKNASIIDKLMRKNSQSLTVFDNNCPPLSSINYS
jgi:hypothetical protein